MNSQIFKEMAMDSDAESRWIPVFLERIPGRRKSGRAVSLQISWVDAGSEPDGKIRLLCSNDMINSAVGMEIDVSVSSNLSDPELIFIHPAFKFFKMHYISNSISSGSLNALMTYV